MQSDELSKQKSSDSRQSAKRSVAPVEIRFSAPYVRSLLEQIEPLERQLAVAQEENAQLRGTIDSLRERI